mmetsp:Transcript_25535/g.81247  ORF Transcript_25535/g.81247 Transcript_25535/m.81247 type:complete len:313 (+) Transcript_25535:953-1891(+)
MPERPGRPDAGDDVVRPVVARGNGKVRGVVERREAPLDLEPAGQKREDHGHRGRQPQDEREEVRDEVERELRADLGRPELVRLDVGHDGLVELVGGGAEARPDALDDSVVETALVKAEELGRSALERLVVVRDLVLLEALEDAVAVGEGVVGLEERGGVREAGGHAQDAFAAGVVLVEFAKVVDLAVQVVVVAHDLVVVLLLELELVRARALEVLELLLALEDHLARLDVDAAIGEPIVEARVAVGVGVAGAAALCGGHLVVATEATKRRFARSGVAPRRGLYELLLSGAGASLVDPHSGCAHGGSDRPRCP